MDKKTNKNTTISRAVAQVLGEWLLDAYSESFNKPVVTGQGINIVCRLTDDQINEIKQLLNEEKRLPPKWKEVLFPDPIPDEDSSDPRGDLDELRRTRETLDQSEFRYRELVENINTAVAVYRAVDDGEDFLIEDFNRAAASIEKVDKEQVIGRRVTEVFPGVVEYGLLDVFRRVYRAGQPEEHPLRMYHDGRISGWRENFIYRLPSRDVVAVYTDQTDLMRSEAALSASEARFHALFTTMAEGVALHEVVYDDEGTAVDYRILDVNPPFERVTGLSRRDAVGRLASVVYTTGEPPYLDIYEKVARTGEPVNFETYFAPMDKYFFVSVFSPERDHFATIFFDVTDRIRAEKALRESEEKFRVISEEISDGLALIVDGKHIWINHAFADIFGYTREEIIDSSFDLVLLAEDVPMLSDRMRRRLAGENVPSRYETRARHKDGEVIDIDVVSKRVDIDGQRSIQLIVRDVTAQKRAEEALRESESKYRTLVELFPHPIVIIQDGAFVFLNQATCELLRVESRGDLLGRSVLDFVVVEDRERIAGYMRDRVADVEGVPNGSETTLLLSSGARAEIEVYVEKITYRGRPALQAMAVDITERKQAELERRHLEAQMMQAQKLESLGVLAGGIAHDFNNLLMGMLGHADLALMEIPKNAPASQSIDEIEKAARQAAELCKQMLAYAGKGRFIMESVDLHRVIEEMAHLLKVSISKRALLKFDFTPNLPAIEADPSQIRQVVMNLILNASDALEGKSGIISVVTGVMECDQGYLTETYLAHDLKEGPYVFLEVADTGCGMDAKTRAKIFDPFFTTKFTGRGLGLAAVLGIVRGHRGAIKVDAPVRTLSIEGASMASFYSAASATSAS